MQKNASVTELPWGATTEGVVRLFTLQNGAMQASISTWGATVTSLMVPDAGGKPGEITLGYDSLAGYLHDSCYMGRIVGRVANRTSGATFELDGVRYELDRNHGDHHHHGGSGGFHSRVWDAYPGEMEGSPCLRLVLDSEDGDQGYPGKLSVSVTYVLGERELAILYDAETELPTPVNLTSHIYFNLSGPLHGDCLGHELQVNATSVQETDEEQLATGALVNVARTALDFRFPKAIGHDIDTMHPLLAVEKGYDHSFVLEEGDGPAAELHDPVSGRRMQMFTDSPCVHFYSGNFIPNGLPGRAGVSYGPRQGLCLEAQEYVNALNLSSAPSIIMMPGQRYRRATRYVFSPS